MKVTELDFRPIVPHEVIEHFSHDSYVDSWIVSNAVGAMNLHNGSPDLSRVKEKCIKTGSQHSRVQALSSKLKSTSITGLVCSMIPQVTWTRFWF